ncbi:MAG: RIP metalloprotease RseP [Candidatus Magasanikbacteria bacterium]
MYILIFILILSLLIFVHEFGHFIVARKSGMKVYEFGFGYPPRAIGVYRDPKTKKLVWVTRKKSKSTLKNTVGGAEKEEEYPATLYTINWLPLGGFVKIKGENGEKVKDTDSFGYHKFWKKALVLIAGVTMNFLLAAVLLGFGFMVGLPADAELLKDKRAIIVEEPAVMVQQVVEDSPAEAAGLAFGDKIIKIDEEEVEDTEMLISYVTQHGNDSISLLVLKNGETMALSVIPQQLDPEDTPKIGVILADAGIIRYPWYIALYKGFVAAAIAVVNILIAFYFLIKNLVMGQGLAFSVAGPVGIAVIVGDSAKLGFSYLINVTAMLSLSLAVLNILPIPALDGGRLVFVIIERVFKKPVPLKYEQAAHTVGFLLLMLLIVVVTWRDVAKLF